MTSQDVPEIVLGAEPAGLLTHYKTDAVKVRARSAARRAAATGKIVKPLKCSVCRRKQQLDGHHPNGYADPLDVVWLCRSCHADAHNPKPRTTSIAKRFPWTGLTILAVLNGWDEPGIDDRIRKKVMAWCRKYKPPITCEDAYRHLFEEPTT